MAQRLGRDTAGGNGAAAGADAAGTDAAGTGTEAAGTETPAVAAGTAAAAAAVATAANGHRSWRRRRAPSPAVPAVAVTGRVDQGPELDLASNDPFVGYLLSEAGVVDITALDLDSPAVDRLKAAGVALVVPLISSGDLIGLVNLGPRLSERDYSSEDRRLLNALAGYAAPALRVGQLVRQQQAEARNRERIEQELKIAQIIQQQFLPKSVPDLPSWHVAAFYRPARTVGGDFYDFIQLPDGRVMFVVGDVTDKGIPAALVMASTHALLRSAAPRLISPGAVLAHVNDLLCADIPAHMFVTCLALVLDPATGQVEFANAGHDVPYVRTAGGVAELRARGMPLGLMPGMDYEEKSFRFQPGDCALLHSDGLAEAHAPDREMFGFPRVAELAGRGASGEALIDLCLTELGAFVGPDAEQEDDITLVSLERTMSAVYAGGDT
jgi:serine phosphatase RsbU (regulator of sigma subunit)